MTTKPHTLLALATALLLALPSLAARADDEDEAPAPRFTARYALRSTLPSPVVSAPALVLPSDAGEERSWLQLLDEEGESPIQFGEDDQGYGVSADDLVALLCGGLLAQYSDEGEISIEPDGPFDLVLHGTQPALRAATKALDWLVPATSPRMPVRAALYREGADPALLTAGSAVLEPGSWTGLYRQQRTTPLVVEWEIEIAEESTAMFPVVARAPEGEELYVRYHPGETVTLVELWTGALAHLSVFEVDLSGIRNVPEASAPGKLQLPQTAGYRAYTAFAIPSGTPCRRELRWDGPAGPVRLVLDLEPPAAVAPPPPTGEMTWRALRSGAACAPLAFERRPSTADRLVEVAHADYDGDGDFNVLTPGFVYYQGDADGASRLTDALRDAESRLVTHHVGLRLLTVAEDALRGPLQSGAVRPGAPVAAQVLEDLAAAGSAPSEAVELYTLDGLDASFRTGKSVLGLKAVDVEVAQRSGGSDPRCDAAFDGFSGEVTVHHTADGAMLDLHARVEHASPEAGTIEVVHRPPVGMASDRDAFPPPSPSDTVRLPVLGWDTAVVANAVLLPAQGDEVLVDLVVRGGEATLVLARRIP